MKNNKLSLMAIGFLATTGLATTMGGDCDFDVDIDDDGVNVDIDDDDDFEDFWEDLWD